jgi:hypothetical protein
VARIRDRTTKKQRKRHDYFGADAIIAWAEKQPLTRGRRSTCTVRSASRSMSCWNENKDFGSALAGPGLEFEPLGH